MSDVFYINVLSQGYVSERTFEDEADAIEDALEYPNDYIGTVKIDTTRQESEYLELQDEVQTQIEDARNTDNPASLPSDYFYF